MSIRQLYVLAKLGFAALGLGLAAPAYAQEVDADVAGEQAFHRDEELAAQMEALRKKMPAAVSAQRWQDALLGRIKKDGTSAVNSKLTFDTYYLGQLFTDYIKADKANKKLTQQWVDALATQLMIRGDGEAFMRLAIHYVKQELQVSFQSPFAGHRLTLGQKLESLGDIINTTMQNMLPDEQREFKESFAIAVATTLVNNCNDSAAKPDCTPQADIIMALMGYRLLTQYVLAKHGKNELAEQQSANKAALQGMHNQLDKYSFKPDELAGLFTHDSLLDLRVVASNFIPDGQTALMLLFEMGPRVDPAVGDAMREVFKSYARDPDNLDHAFYLFDYTYALAYQQGIERRSQTLAQQIVSPEWQVAISNALTIDRMQDIYLANYLGSSTVPTQSLYAARAKELGTADEAKMPAIFMQLLKRTANKPEAFYRVMNDFWHKPSYQQVLATFQPSMSAEQVTEHFKYLAQIYVDQPSLGQTADSLFRLNTLMKVNASSEISQHMRGTVFRDAIMHLAVEAAGDETKSYQIAKLVHNAVTSGWSNLVDTVFIEQLLTKLKGADAYESLATVLRVQADERALKKRWEAVTKPAAPAKK